MFWELYVGFIEFDGSVFGGGKKRNQPNKKNKTKQKQRKKNTKH